MTAQLDDVFDLRELEALVPGPLLAPVATHGAGELVPAFDVERAVFRAGGAVGCCPGARLVPVL